MSQEWAPFSSQPHYKRCLQTVHVTAPMIKNNDKTYDKTQCFIFQDRVRKQKAEGAGKESFEKHLRKKIEGEILSASSKLK